MKTPKVLLVNPSGKTTKKALVLPAAQVTLAGAIPAGMDVEPVVVDEAIQRFDPNSVGCGDIVSVSVLTNNCREAYRVVRAAKASGASVIVGGPHCTLLPEEALRFGADAVVRGEGDVIFGKVLTDIIRGTIVPGGIYQDPDGQPFLVKNEEMAYPRLDLVDLSNYWTTSLRSARGCRENCTFCTVPKISGRKQEYRPVEDVAREIRELHDGGIRAVVWGADSLVQVPLSVVKAGRNPGEIKALEAERQKSLDFFRQLAKLTGKKRVWGFAQLTLRLFDDPEMLDAIRNDAAICAALFGIESIDPAGLRAIAKQWNGTPAEIAKEVRDIQKAGIHVLGSMIVGLPTDTPETPAAARRFAVESGMSVAQFPLYELLPGSADYAKAERDLFQRERSAAPSLFPMAVSSDTKVPRVKLLRHEWWLEPADAPPHLEHPHMTMEALRAEGRKSWRYFYRLDHLLRNSLRRRWPLLRVFVYTIACKGFSLFYSGPVGISGDSARAGETSFLLRKLMAAGAWLMRRIPPPPAAS